MNKKILSIAIIVVLIIGGIWGFTRDNGFSQEELDNVVNQAVEDAKIDSANGYVTILTEKDTEIANLQTSLEESLKAIEVEENEEVAITGGSFIGYLIDKYFIDKEVVEDISDREVTKLVDSEVEFDGEDYDVEEVIELSNMKVLVNKEDFESEPYLVISENAVKYTVIFDNDLKTGSISEDNGTLTFSFLGDDVEVSEWKSSSITFTKGEEFYLTLDEAINVGEDVIVLSGVFTGSSDKIQITVNGQSEVIKEGQTEKVNGLEVYVKEVLSSGYAGGDSRAIIVVGDDVENTIKDEEKYSKDSIWEWVITNHSIGLRLIEDFEELDGDYKPLASGELLCLPNDYVCVRYNGFEEEDTEELSFRLKKDYVEIRGNFQYGLEDYDVIFVNRSNSVIFNEYDEVLNESVITLGSSKVNLTSSISGIYIEDFWVDLDLNNSNVEDKDYDVRTVFGIKVNSPEDAREDSKWKIIVPYEQLESTFWVY